MKFNFTKASIDALPLPAHGKRAAYGDTKAIGLQIRVTSTGVKTFSVYRRIKQGNPERVTLGKYPDMTIDQARREAVRIASDIHSGLNPAQIKRGTKGELTFNELFSQYMERHSRPSKITWKEDQAKYERYLLKPMGSRKLSDINRKDIASIHQSISHQTTANRVLALVSSVFGWAIRSDLHSINPSIGIRRNREHSRDRFLQGDELPRFFQALSEELNYTLRDYILMSLLTGARRANVLAMRWDDINFDRAEWRIPQTKNGEPHTIPLNPRAIKLLRNRLNRSVWVFPGKGCTGHLVEPKKGFKRILERAGIENLRLHDLRRTLGSYQAITGASLAIIGKSLGHKSQNTTAIYARLDSDPVRGAMDIAIEKMFSH